MPRLVAVIMAGGRATRMGGVAKPMLPVCGEPMLVRVARVAMSVAQSIVVAASPFTANEVRSACSLGFIDSCVVLSGSGYPEDVALVARLIPHRPLLVLPSDTPFLSASALRDFINKAMRIGNGLVTLETSKAGPIGVSLLLSGFEPWRSIVVKHSPTWLNVNTWRDYVEAEKLCETQSS